MRIPVVREYTSLQELARVNATITAADSSHRHESDQFLIVDAIFGFSFVGTPRSPFDAIIREMSELRRDAKAKIISVDIP